jgi:hypothetical protein
VGWDNNMNEDVEQLDPFMGLYVHEKINDPQVRFMLRQFREQDVRFVDKLISEHKSAGGNETVKTDKDWDVLKSAFDYFAKRWPEDYQAYKKAQQDIRTTRGKGGYSQSKEIKYLASLPVRFERIIKRLYPDQQFDKAFMYKLVKRMNIFKVGGEQN